MLDASLLLHIIDASDPGFERQLEVTDDVLAEIDAQDVPRIRIFNKIDHVGDAVAQTECDEVLFAKYPSCIVMNACRPNPNIARVSQAAAFWQANVVFSNKCQINRRI